MNVCMPGVECLVQNICNIVLWLYEKNFLMLFLILFIILLLIIFCLMFKNGD